MALHAAWRGESDDGYDAELEAGGDDEAMMEDYGSAGSERNEAMARRVEAIRNKYRPPVVGGSKRNVD